MGLADVPSAGDTFAAVEDEKLARELVEKRRQEAKEEQFKAYHQVTLDNLFSSIEEGTVKELPDHRQGRRTGFRRGCQAVP